MDGREGVAFLSGSDGRVAVLRALSERPCRPCELREHTGASRTAIHRSLSGFEERGWVRKDGERYTLTAAGRHVFEAYDRLARAVERGDRFSEFLAAFDRADEMPFPVEGETCVATPTEPQAPSTFFLENLPEDADRLRGFSPVLTQALVERFEPTVGSGTDIELVYDEPIARRALEVYPETMAMAIDSDNVTIHVVSDPVETGLALFDDEVFLKAYGEQGSLRACLRSRDERLLEWAAGWYDRRTADTRPLTRYTADIESV
jgi:predicted transcriptional regulator